MITSSARLRQEFKAFWEAKDHKESPPSPLVLKEDPTTLFNSSGMQPLVPYLLGETHPLGKRLYNIQPSIRTQDIDEVGDNRHTTFFEMMGNWSLGDYFKKEQIEWVYDFYINVVGIPKEKVYVSVFEGNNEVSRDEESVTLWKKLGIPENRIYYYSVEKNWWSRSGPPEKMPVGEVGGPDTEMFYEFDTPHDKKYGPECHPNCDCGRFMEFANSVFIQYKKSPNGNLEELPQKNVDFGGGLERITAITNNDPDLFKTDLFMGIIQEIEKQTNKSYTDDVHKSAMRIIADHVKAATFLIAQGVQPSNKEHGYVLRRLLRRSAVKMHKLRGDFNVSFDTIIDVIVKMYETLNQPRGLIIASVQEEMKRFTIALGRGMRELSKIHHIDGKTAFNLYQSFGFPLELTKELAKEKGQTINHEEFKNEFNKHKELSRTASVGMFKGGLADESEQTVKYHTATHLLHQALFDVLGSDVRQEGSNITKDRLRFDFYSGKKPEPQDYEKVQKIITDKVTESLPVSFKMLPKDEALQVGARSFFKQKYPDMVKVYYVGNNLETAYSKEFCGGPHVKNTSEIGNVKIFKTEKIGSNLYRVYIK